ncbi:MAG: NAD-dependent epimerase/dehydratase family protein [Spirochaetia bacterium]|nr:NAD-dependent epimerase/dehydratase family protein [Spirochaetia bacterium]
MKILIIGVSGFLGNHLLRLLRLEENRIIIGTGKKSEYTGKIPLERYISLDITKFKDVKTVIEEIKPTHVYNMAGIIPGIRENLEDAMLQVNCMGAINILESVKQICPNTKILFVGSAAEYGSVKEGENPIDESHFCKPVGFYGVSKYYMSTIAQDYFQKWNLQVVIARPFNLIGPEMSFETVAGAFLKRSRAALNLGNIGDVKMGDLTAERDFLDVRDVIRGCILLMNQGNAGEIYNIASGTPIKIEYIIQTLQSYFQGRIRLVKDKNIKKNNDVSRVYGNADKIKKLGFEVKITLEESLYDSWKFEMEDLI